MGVRFSPLSLAEATAARSDVGMPGLELDATVLVAQVHAWKIREFDAEQCRRARGNTEFVAASRNF